MIRDAMINRTEEEWDALQDALGTLWGWMKAGHVITEQDVADFTLIDKCQREDEEAATDAYNRGYEDGLRTRGGDELIRLTKAADEARIESSTARAMEHLANQRLDTAEAARQSAQDKIKRKDAALEEVKAWLTNPEWGKWRYMEGSDIYTDRDSCLNAIEAAIRPNPISDGPAGEVEGG